MKNCKNENKWKQTKNRFLRTILNLNYQLPINILFYSIEVYKFILVLFTYIKNQTIIINREVFYTLVRKSFIKKCIRSIQYKLF